MSVSARVLVVDDEAAVRDLLARGLRQEGYEAVAAEDGEEALKKLSERDFQVVISDVKMPKLGGLGTLAAIKNINPDVEVIMVTGEATVSDAVNAMKQGAYDFIQKPLEMGVILALVEKALEKRELKALVALHEIGGSLFRTMELDALVEIAAKSTRAVLRADEVLIALLEGGRLEVAAAVGLDDGERLKERVALMERAAARKLIEEEPRVLVCPMNADGKALGLLCAGRNAKNDEFLRADMRHLTLLSSQIAQAARNAGIFQRLRDGEG